MHSDEHDEDTVLPPVSEPALPPSPDPELLTDADRYWWEVCAAARVNVLLMSETRDQLQPILDRWAAHIQQPHG